MNVNKNTSKAPY